MAGNSDMANGNGHIGDEARFAALSQRVLGIETSVQTLSNQFSSFVAKLDERQRTPWGLIVSVSVALLLYVTTIGGLAYAPVWASLGRMDVTLTKLQDSAVTQAEMQWRTERSKEDRQRTDTAIAILRDEQVPRKELERVWDAGNQRDADLQRQIDQVAQNTASTITPRDAIMDLRERLDRLERDRSTTAQRQSP